MKNLRVSGSITNTSNTTTGGGVAAINDGRIENCCSSVTIIATATGNNAVTVGGVVGRNYGSVTNCYNTGGVSGSGGGPMSGSGGVVGGNFNGTVTNCYFMEDTADKGIGFGSDTATEKDDTAFHSGAVAYLLQGNQATPVWGQDLTNKDSWPTPIALDKSVQPVYQVTVVYGSYEGAPDEKTIYTNGTAPDKTPTRDDGFVFAGWTESKRDDINKTITYTATPPSGSHIPTASALRQQCSILAASPKARLSQQRRQ